jgi:two-component system, LytTR family, response regulator
MTRAIIIDDEPNAIGLLSLRLSQHCPQVEVVATCTSSLEGLQAMVTHQPDLLFLDIEMPRMNGFQLLEAVADLSFSLIFVTAYDRFALKAFRYSAVDYLLKPIDTGELVQAMNKVEKQRPTTVEQVDYLRQQFSTPGRSLPDNIALPYQNGVAFVALKDVLYCESDDSYTKFYVADGQHYLVTKTLKEIQELLEERNFLRVHRQFMVNLGQIRKFVRSDGSYLVMANGQSIPVSRSHKDRLTERFGWL